MDNRIAASQLATCLLALVLLMLWLIPTLGMILNRLELPLMPLVILAFGWFAWQRLGALKPA